MFTENMSSIIIVGLILIFLAWKYLRNKKVKTLIPDYLKQGAIVVDVRTSAEFLGGSRPGSLNIPLDQLEKRHNELDKSKPVLLCCASGARSGVALGILKQKGFSEVINVGPWTNTLG